MTNHTSLMTRLVSLTNSKHGNIGSHWFMKKMKLDTYISGKVLVLEWDEAKSLTQQELGQGQEYNCWLNHESPYTISVFLRDTERDVWFLDQDTWRKEHKSKDDFKKPVEECEDPECWDHIVILYKGLSNQRTTLSSRRRSGESRSCDNHLEWPPRIMRIHSFEKCVPDGSDYFQQTLGRAHTRWSSTHNKRREDGRNSISSTHDSKNIP